MLLIRLAYVLATLLTGFLVIRSMTYYSRKENSARNISPSYFAAIALLFALFASLVFSEVWGRISRINQLMLTQANALRGILRITENLPGASLPYRQAVADYIQTISEMDKQEDSAAPKASTFSNQTFQPLYVLATNSSLFDFNPVVQQAILEKTDELRNAWFERKELLKQRILPEKILVLFLMGFFTQFSIAFSHLGNDRAMRDTVWLFSLAFFTALALLVCIDDTAWSSHFISLAALKDVH
jgi:hypothetical protein